GPLYGIEGQGWFMGFYCFTSYVKLTFFRGRSLRPVPPGESKHPEVRYFNIYENDRLDAAQLADWIDQARKLPGEKLAPQRRATMAPELQPYHAHIYFERAQRGAANRLRQQVLESKGRGEFATVLFVGELRDDPVGPHPKGQFEIHFREDAVPQITSLI